MVPDGSNAAESRITTDPKQIEKWARETDSVPVREGGQLRMIDEGRFDDARHERVDWDDFENEIQNSDRVVVYMEGAGRDQLQVRHRDDAMHHLEGEDVENRLISGEVITGKITETAVVERTIVEEAEIRSEVVESDVVDSQIVDVELLTRECSSCTPHEAAEGNYLDTYDESYFFGESDADVTSKEDLTFDLEVNEAWSVTMDELEEFVVESRVTDVDLAETDAVEDIDLETDVDMAGLHQQILSSNLFSIDIRQMEEFNAENYAIESEIHEGDTIRTTIGRHRTLDREVAMSHDVTASGTESRRTNVQTADEQIVSTGLAEPGAETAGWTHSEEVVETEVVGETERPELRSGDEGKTVVDTDGKELGVVAAVEGEQLYVEPHPSLTEKVMARLGWGDEEDEYVVDADQISHITDDRIELYKPE